MVTLKGQPDIDDVTKRIIYRLLVPWQHMPLLEFALWKLNDIMTHHVPPKTNIKAFLKQKRKSILSRQIKCKNCVSSCQQTFIGHSGSNRCAFYLDYLGQLVRV